MDNENILYYDGTNARSSIVRVLVFQNKLHLRKDEDLSFNESFSFDESFVNQIGDTTYFYLDRSGLKYLQFKSGNPVAEVLFTEIETIKGGWGQSFFKQRTAIILLVVLGLVIGLYMLIVTFIPLIGMRLIGVEQEIQLGEKLKDLTLKESPVLGRSLDSKRTKDLQHFADQLQLSGIYPIKIIVVKSDIVNAFALPGGNVVVYSGILEKIETPEALVALLAHESTHINQRHSLRSLLRSTANAIILSVVFGDASGISGAIAGHLETLNGLRYSRELENEADEKGMELMLQNRVNIGGMKQLMQMLQKQDKMPESLSFLSTHPLSEKRVAAADRFLSTHSARFKPRRELEEIFQSLKGGQH